MAALQSHWFELVPQNDRAIEVAEHPNNAHLLTTTGRRPALRVGHVRSNSGISTLATLGRGAAADIFIANTSISKIQCSFELELHNDAVMLYDRSHGETTQVFGEEATPFEHGRIRRVVVLPEMNIQFGMGGARRDLIVFMVVWNKCGAPISQKTQDRRAVATILADDPRMARTINEEDTEVPSRRETRIHTPGSKHLKMRYYKGKQIGAGSFGEVYRAVDADTGRLMAVKRLRLTPRQAINIKREIEILAKLEHPHIVEYIAANCNDSEVEIFMGLMEHNLESLIGNGIQTDNKMVLHQLLQALDNLALHRIIHRDVKPANVFLNALPHGKCHVRLGDFGLSNRIADARTHAGTDIFMAPEIYFGQEQSDKSDVYSLYVTMVWVLNVRDFRSAAFDHYANVQRCVNATLNDPGVDGIQRMGCPVPADRASAADILIERFGGQGLSTQGRQPAAAAEMRQQTAPDMPVSTSEDPGPAQTGRIPRRGVGRILRRATERTLTGATQVDKSEDRRRDRSGRRGGLGGGGGYGRIRQRTRDFS